MSYREKVAWLALVTMIVGYGFYFTAMAVEPPSQTPMWPMRLLASFAAVTVPQVIVIIAGSILLAALSPSDARARPDERDRAIRRRSAMVAYYVLIVGTVLVGVAMPFGNRAGGQIVNAALLAIVVAEIVRYAMTVLSYRRGWHG